MTGWLSHDQWTNEVIRKATAGEEVALENIGSGLGSDTTKNKSAWLGIYNKHHATATTGYIYRRLFKMLEDVCVQNDGTVRQGNGRLIQGSYGDGFMPKWCTEVEVLTSPLEDSDVARFKTLQEDRPAEFKIIQDEMEQLQRDRQSLAVENEAKMLIKSPFDVQTILGRL